MWSAETSIGSESLKIKWSLVPYTRGQGLDLGCGSAKPFQHFIGMDNNIDSHLFGTEASARTLTGNCEKLTMFASESMDFVFSSHLLEHIEDYKATLKEWFRVIRAGGHLCLYLPHKDFYPNIGTEGSNPDHKHDFLPEDITEAMHECPGWDLIVNEDRNEKDEYSFFQVYRKTRDEKCRILTFAKPEKTAAVIRYGAYGDMLQSLSVCPGLKDQGYHVTVFCTPRGVEVVNNNPHVDAIVLQDEDQVLNHELGDYFAWLSTRYTKVINLCEAVEGVLLPMSLRAHFHWPKEARHAICNRNYVEIQHMIAGVPYEKPLSAFYPTVNESKWVISQLAQMQGPVIAWALSGSAMHKIWPHVDAVVNTLMERWKKCSIVFIGGPREESLQGEYTDPRVIKAVGKWSIRESIAFAQRADVVVGPETGLLNAVAMERNHKVVLLSHSTEENLTRDWINTTSICAQNVSCYPCHQLHLDGWKYCNRHPEGTAACQMAIKPEWVLGAIINAVEQKRAA